MAETLGVNLMQSIVSKFPQPLDGRLLCRMRLVCHLWKRLIDGLPECYLKAIKEHLVVLDTTCHLDEHLVSGYNGRAHSLRSIGPLDAQRVFIHALHTQMNINPFLIFRPFDTPAALFFHLALCTVIYSVAYLTDRKSGDLWIILPRDSVVRAKMTEFLTLFKGVLQWKLIDFRTTHHVYLRKMLGAEIYLPTSRLFCIHICVKDVEKETNPLGDFNYTKANTLSKLRQVARTGQPRMNATEMTLSNACREMGYLINSNNRKKKKRRVNDDSF
jgi:hypothetical protein